MMPDHHTRFVFIEKALTFIAWICTIHVVWAERMISYMYGMVLSDFCNDW